MYVQKSKIQDYRMHSGKVSLGLIVSFLLVFVYQPQVWAQDQHRAKAKNKIDVRDAEAELKQWTQNNTLKRTANQQISSKLSMELNDLLSEHEQLENNTTSANNPDVEQFGNVDENNKKERTFPFLTNFLSNLLNRRTCIYPCTLEAYHEQQCCPPEILTVPVPISPQHCNTCNLPPFPQQFNQNFLPQLPGSHPHNFPNPSLNSPRLPQNLPFPFAPPFQGQFFQPFTCCSVCTQYTFYGPPPCQYFGRSIA